MGLKAKFSSNEVARRLKIRGKRTTLALRNRLGQAAREFHTITFMLAPVKTGTLQKAIRIRQENPNKWVVWINEDQKVPKRRNKDETTARFVKDYLPKIESGNFKQIGKKSRAKEASTNKRRLAGLRVRRSPQGSYVGGIFFGRTLDAIEPKWQSRFDKVFKSAMERGII